MKPLVIAAVFFASVIVAPEGALAQGLPADDEILLPGSSAPPPPPAARPAPRAERPAKRAARGTERRRARRGRASRPADPPARYEPIEEETDGPPRDTDPAVRRYMQEEAEAARLEEEGIEYEVRQEMEYEERRRRGRDGRSDEEEEPPPARESDEPSDEEIEREVRREMEREERERERARQREAAAELAEARAEEREEREEREESARAARGTPPDLVRVEVGVSASTRAQTIDAADGSTIHFGLTPFASAFGQVVLTPLSRVRGGPRGLGVALAYDRAIRMEAVTEDQVLEASADHFAAMLLYRFLLPGRVRIEPRIGYDLARFLLAPNETLPGIVYESIAVGGQVQIPIIRDPRTGGDRLRVRLGASMFFPIGLGEAAARWGQAGTASGFAFEGGVEGVVSGMFGYFALLRHATYSATFHAPEAAGETKSSDGMTTGLCGGSVRF